MKQTREKRLNSEFRSYIYEILKYEIKDPNFENMFTILDVETDGDLKTAKVYVSIYAKDEQTVQNTLESMKAAAPKLRKEISSRMHIRTVPEFIFHLDRSSEYGQKIDDIISKFTYGEHNDDNN